MLLENLKFNPHLIWADDDGYHVFGYKNQYYFHKTPKDTVIFSKTIAHGDNLDNYYFSEGIIHFNEIIINPRDNNYYLYKQNWKARLGKKSLKLLGHYSRSQKSKKAFEDNYLYLKTPSGLIIPLSANYDIKDDIVVYAWGKSFVFREKNHYQFFGFENSCCDARISPDGKKVAVLVGEEIRFFDITTKEFRTTLHAPGYIGHYAAFSKDGLTLSVITKNHKMITWDME